MINESVETFFSILFGKLPNAAKLILYDNACHLHNFCMKREPAYFDKTIFVSDTFHSSNHVGCNDGYIYC